MNVRFGPDGLAPAIVQDAADGRILMLAYMDAEALSATERTGEAHFHSRLRDELWHKGETSGHILRVRSIDADCDGDALLLTVDPVGPTCHRETRSCFDPAGAPAEATTQGFGWLETLWSTIADRIERRPPGSYTSRLIDGGVDATGRKVVEEATETLLAARDDAEAERAGRDRAGTKRALAGEAADLLYHALVVLAERRLEPRLVIEALRARHAPAETRDRSGG